LPELRETSWGGAPALVAARRIGRGDIHRCVVAALIGEHGRNIFPLVRRRPCHCLGSSPRRGEPEQD